MLLRVWAYLELTEREQRLHYVLVCTRWEHRRDLTGLLKTESDPYCRLCLTANIIPSGNMEHNLDRYRSQLLQSILYGASPVFLRGTGWQPDRSGHVLIDKTTNGNAVASVVGRVLDHCLNCGPNVNFIDCNYRTLAMANYQLQLGEPQGTPFAPDYDKVLDHQGSSSSSTHPGPPQPYCGRRTQQKSPFCLGKRIITASHLLNPY